MTISLSLPPQRRSPINVQYWCKSAAGIGSSKPIRLQQNQTGQLEALIFQSLADEINFGAFLA
ncbi:hypothetical protein NP603_01130 [Methylomonas sp. SURF-1]|uniref:Uncharacterized protein n=1 Tax=Methylomonas aurea TaxID=2952224 RepID=A0ABT1UC15_9GAMM|nr:hypothetical protein [Methylomonas sp. SURF-1]MCQ8179697.1 hypothetical protein [Methylomonas sp. SURF-1]